MYKLRTSARDTGDLYIGFDQDRVRRQQELTINKTQKGIFHLRKMLKDIFGFAERQAKATYGFEYKLTITRNVDNAVLNKTDATVAGKIQFNFIKSYVPLYTPSVSNQAILSKQILNKTPTELQNVEKSVFY